MDAVVARTLPIIESEAKITPLVREGGVLPSLVDPTRGIGPIFSIPAYGMYVRIYITHRETALDTDSTITQNRKRGWGPQMGAIIASDTKEANTVATLMMTIMITMTLISNGARKSGIVQNVGRPRLVYM